MKKGLTEIVFILDRSGSMSGLEADTIGGFNSMIEKQRKETNGPVYVWDGTFDNSWLSPDKGDDIAYINSADVSCTPHLLGKSSVGILVGSKVGGYCRLCYRLSMDH